MRSMSALWCAYAKNYTHIKAVWILTITDTETPVPSCMLRPGPTNPAPPKA